MNNSVVTNGKSVEEAVRKALEELQTTEDQVTIEVLEEESGFLGLGAKAKVRVTKLAVAPAEVATEEAPAEETPVVEAALEETVEAVAEAPVAASQEVETEEETTEVDTTEGDSAEAETTEEALSEEEQEQVATEAIRDFLQKILDGFGLSEVNEVKVTSEDNRILATIDGDDCGILIGRRGETLNSLQYLCSLVANRSTHSRMRVSLDIGGYKAKREDSVSSLALRTAQRAVRTQQAYELTPMSSAERRVVHEVLQSFPGVVTYSEGDEPNRYVVIDLAYEDEKFSNDDEQV